MNQDQSKRADEATVPSSAGELDPYSAMLTRVAEAVSPSVVRLDLWRNNGERAGSGSGVIVSPDGFVLTNSHVVQGARRAEATTTEGRVLSARVLGNDPDTDLALLRIDEGAQLPSARLGDSRQLKHGQIVR